MTNERLHELAISVLRGVVCNAFSLSEDEWFRDKIIAGWEVYGFSSQNEAKFFFNLLTDDTPMVSPSEDEMIEETFKRR